MAKRAKAAKALGFTRTLGPVEQGAGKEWLQAPTCGGIKILWS
jgi:hypothetical protein